MASRQFAVAVGNWHMMVARLLLAVAGYDEESSLSSDLVRARQLATLVGEEASVVAALSRTLVEPAPSKETVPYVSIELAEWSEMRANLLLEVVVAAGSAVDAYPVLGVPLRWLRKELRAARRTTL